MVPSRAGSGSRELVQRALQGLPVSRVPWGPLAVHFCARLAGCSVRRYSTDAEALTESVLAFYRRFRPDALWVSADTWVSAEAMGTRVGSPSEDLPLGGVGPPLIRTIRDIERIPPPDPDTQGRYPLMREALSRLQEQVGQETFLVGCFDQYPFSLAAALAGLERVMVLAVEDPPFLLALMERCLEYSLAYARALRRAGADMLSGGDSPAGLLGPRLYRELALPFEMRLIRQLKAEGSGPVSLHICGNALPILKDMAGSGADVLEIDHNVDIAEACRRVGPDVAIWGNLDTVGVLSQGGPADVGRAVREALDAVKAAGHPRFVLSSGCTLAWETPGENLDAARQAAGEYPLRE